MSQNVITQGHVRKALLDPRFRNRLPSELSGEVAEYLDNPGCPCHGELLAEVARKHSDLLKAYYPSLGDVEPPPQKLSRAGQWIVINCPASKLESELRRLPVEPIQLDVARWEDQVTVVVRFLSA